MRSALCIAVAIVALAAPAAASADVMGLYQGLSARRLSPAPLVPTTAPRSLSPLDRTAEVLGSRRRSGYGIRLVSTGPDAIIALQGGNFRTIKTALRNETRVLGFKAKRTRVRGRAGYLLTRRLGPAERELLWSESGRVYQLASGTPKTVSLKALRATAAGLDRLERDYVGTGGDPDLGDGAVAVTTEHTITIDVTWGAHCVMAGGLPAADHGGGARPTLLRRQGAAFGFDLARFRTGELAWAGSVSGTIGPDAIVLSMQASGFFDGATCDTGPVTYALDQRPMD
jgi:hypothetical protein